MAEPRVSVITIFRDPGAFFEAALDSVSAQSYPNVEHLLVDDGSRDGSSEVARRLAASEPDRVTYLEHPGHGNLGTSCSRNLGLAHARGEFVAFLDADDVWFEDAVSRQVAWLEAHPRAAMVIGATLEWRTWDPDASVPDSIYRVGPAGLRRAGARLAVDLVTGRVLAPSMNALMARRDAVMDVGGFEDDFRDLYEDQVVAFKMFLSYPVLFHRQVIDRYRQHGGSIYAQGLASGFDRIGAPSEARSRFVAFAEDHARRAGTRAGRDAARAIRQRRWIDDHAPVERWGMRLRPSNLGHFLQRVRGRILRHNPSVLPRSLPPRPVSGHYGFDRGQPVDRRYIEGFLSDHAIDIQGRVLEVGESTYSRRFGGERVDRVDVLHVDDGHAETTILADLTDAPQIPDASFDCVIVTQTLHLIYDVSRAVATLERILRPGGVLLVTVPGISPMTEQEGWGHFWTFTDRSAQQLFEGCFPEVVVHVYGNVVAAASFLYGFAQHEVPADALEQTDRRFPVIVAVRTRKSVAGSSPVTDPPQPD